MPDKLSTLAVYKSGISMFTDCVLKKSVVYKLYLYTNYTQKERPYTHHFTQAFSGILSLLSRFLYTQSTGLITVTTTYINKLIIRDADKSLAY